MELLKVPALFLILLRFVPWLLVLISWISFHIYNSSGHQDMPLNIILLTLTIIVL